MITDIKGFDETTLCDANQVVADMFSVSSCVLLDKILANPMRVELQALSSGDIAYQDGIPVAFQAAIVRKMYFRQTPFIGVVGSTLCSKPQTSPVLLMQLMKRTIAPRYGSKLFFANTAIPKSAKMNKILGVKGVGPETNQVVRFSVLRWGGFLNVLMKNHLPSFCVAILDLITKIFWRKPKIKTRLRCSVDTKFDGAYDLFWNRYLEKNNGIAVSRSRDELNWMFGSDIERGRAKLISLRDDTGIVGYVIAKSRGGGLERWMIVDWIALENEEKILRDLLSQLIRLLKSMHEAIWIESIGFAPLADDTLGQFLKFKRRLRENVFVYKTFGDRIAKALCQEKNAGWFFGPYDGDRCL